jgi:hypothetical protein
VVPLKSGLNPDPVAREKTARWARASRTIAAMEEPWPPPAVAPPTDEAAARAARRGWALILFLVALASGGLTFALLQVEGFVAISGQRAVARVSRCDASPKGSCFVVVQTPTGVTLDTDAEMPKRASKGDELRVRYRSGKAVPDTPWGRIRPLLLVGIFGAVSVAALVGTVVSAFGRGSHSRS